jgi:hypothetical protein
LQNLLNLLNKNWGRQFELGNNQWQLLEFAGFKSNTDLTPQFRLDPGMLAGTAWKTAESGEPAYTATWNCRLGVRISW